MQEIPWLVNSFFQGILNILQDIEKNNKVLLNKLKIAGNNLSLQQSQHETEKTRDKLLHEKDILRAWSGAFLLSF